LSASQEGLSSMSGWATISFSREILVHGSVLKSAQTVTRPEGTQNGKQEGMKAACACYAVCCSSNSNLPTRHKKTMPRFELCLKLNRCAKQSVEKFGPHWVQYSLKEVSRWCENFTQLSVKFPSPYFSPLFSKLSPSYAPKF
jgi:hypothetical protein